MSDPMACPHCENITPRVRPLGGGSWKVLCGACGAASGERSDEASAVTSWNRRTAPPPSAPSGSATREELLSVWQCFLDSNPSDVTSPEEYPDHALVTFDEFAGMVDAWLASRGAAREGE